MHIKKLYYKDSKEWWQLAKEIRGKQSTMNPTIPVNDLMSHFKELLNPEQFSHDIQYAAPLIEEDELDRRISKEEIKEALTKVKLNKAPGENIIDYEFLIHSTD